MFKDFGKVETFLTVVRERSFSKASKKLGISQPAVTQQIKYLEDYLSIQIVDRKKNGINLTKAGEALYQSLLKLEKQILETEKEVLRLINKEMLFILGASPVIGNYILPDFLNDIQEVISNRVLTKVATSSELTELLLQQKVDLALIESPIFNPNITYREWMEDELVVVSRSKLPMLLKKEDLFTFDWICREEESNTRRVIYEMFRQIDVDCKNFNVKGIATSSTTIKQTLLKSPLNGVPTVSILSKYIIEDEVKQGLLHVAQIKDIRLLRQFYLCCLKDRVQDALIDSTTDFLTHKSIQPSF
ncbi:MULTISPECIES: LysR family transcriptional regulator [unclassified Sulfurospirillum]|uniref:LysR family transcriptional regulator n=1 Tax=unclassified Sulfurospirillum TaxID=2618290 RepID=UPI000541F06E|nr:MULTISPECIES: LysR family transcriptional regulator [unclassified Sulfurospirillum]KHG32882.1 MAG: LysR family transcriptional regulator [Sulfurospirillum sp. MES]MCP3652525.1 LysR family transcriptional regulator [Sulfurospirillum sp. DNRA8]MCR1811376.1 LysR family transcriptional regulator [Sulfurospirillum sp. DNRA8]